MPQRIAVILGAGATVLVAGVMVFFAVSEPAPPPPPPGSTPAAPSAAAEPVAPTAPLPAASRRSAQPARAEPPAAPAPVEAAPVTGSIRVDSDVPDTSVFVDRVYLGTAPLTSPELPPGRHEVKLVPTGYESTSEIVEVIAGEERHVSASFKTIRLDVSIVVSHKHAFGSCSGALQASPQGLTYETTNSNDAFTVALLNMETFEVDYLAKKLTVKVRGGKTYTFTDPESNADRLFVFHRDVDKVRRRLAGGGTPESF